MPSLTKNNGKLGIALAAHLLRRCTYSVTKAQIDVFAELTAQQAVDKLVDEIPPYFLTEPIHPSLGTSWLDGGQSPPEGENEGVRRKAIRSWYFEEARKDVSIRSKMVFFMHHNFVTSLRDGNDYNFWDHLKLLDRYALGNFKALAVKMSVDNLMLRYLNNNLNLKDSPNENYAREFLELFTIGKGPQRGEGDYTHYTEGDISEAARVLTGFRARATRFRNKNGSYDPELDTYLDPDTGIFRGYGQLTQHDQGNKTFSDAFQGRVIQGATSREDMWRELQDLVNMVFDQEETARFICRKLYRFFVGRNITAPIESDIIEPLAATFRQDYEIKPVLKQLLKSQHFFGTDDGNPENNIIGSMIRPPLDLVLQTLTFFELKVPDMVEDYEQHLGRYAFGWLYDTLLNPAGMSVFEPDDVAGYPAYYQESDYHRQWFTSNTIIPRYYLPEMLLSGRRILKTGGIGGVLLNLVPWFLNRLTDHSDAEKVVRQMVVYLLPGTLSEERFSYFLNEVFLDGLSPLSWYYDNWLPFEASRFKDESFVKPPLDRLFKAIIWSQEYQLH